MAYDLNVVVVVDSFAVFDDGFGELVDAPGGRVVVVVVVVVVSIGSWQDGMLSGQSRPPTATVIGCSPTSLQVSVQAARPL